MASFGSASCRRLALIILFASRCSAFLLSSSSFSGAFTQRQSSASVVGSRHMHLVQKKGPSTTGLRMGLDLVTYLRTEWISAALCTNQTPRSADVCLQIGTEDGRAGTYHCTNYMTMYPLIYSITLHILTLSMYFVFSCVCGVSLLL